MVSYLTQNNNQNLYKVLYGQARSVSLTTCPITIFLSTPIILAFLLFLALHNLFPVSRTPSPQVFSQLALSLHSDTFLNITIAEKFSLTALY